MAVSTTTGRGSDVVSHRRESGGDFDAGRRAAKLERVEKLAQTMDNIVRIPGTNIRLGLDSLAGLIPGVGDAAALAPALYIVNEARALGVRNRILARMLGNVGIDWVIGTIPLLGDIFDVSFKANTMNVELLRREIESGKI
ncbi:MAG: DUF4112 domain-containing protein [Pseudomonadota bacterium]